MAIEKAEQPECPNLQHARDMIGKYFKYRIAEPGIASADQVGLINEPGVMVTAPARNPIVGRARSNAFSGGPIPPPMVGRGAPPPLPPRPFPFAWLNYVRGGATATSGNRPVLTGKMSGCYIFTFQLNGENRVAHVGTVDSSQSRDSIAAKRAWMDFCDNGVASPIENRPGMKPVMVMGGSPSDAFTADEKFAAAKAASSNKAPIMPFVLCYTDATQAMFSMLCYAARPEDAPVQGEMDWIKVVDVRPMRLQPWSAISALRTFQDMTIADTSSYTTATGVIKGHMLGQGLRH